MMLIQIFLVSLQPESLINPFTIMARPIRETPVLKGEDAFNFEMRRLEVDNMSKDQRAENRRKLDEQVERAEKYIKICF